MFGLATAGVLGAVGAGIAALLGFSPLLWATAAVFVAAGVLAVRLPQHVDVPASEEPVDGFATADRPRCPPARGGAARSARTWSLALRAQAALRGLGGFLTIFTAFLVQATYSDGWSASIALGSVAVAAGARQPDRHRAWAPGCARSPPTASSWARPRAPR